ncbi:hypothetical protein [Ralstonia pseudosolanacearum]
MHHWRGSKKTVVTPLDTPRMRALGLAHYWQRLLNERRFASMAEIAEAEAIGITQVRRLLRLTLPAPEVVEQLIVSPKAKLEPIIRSAWSTDWYCQAERLPYRTPPELSELPVQPTVADKRYRGSVA